MFLHYKSRVKLRLFVSYFFAFVLLLSLVFGLGYSVFAGNTIEARLEIHETVSRQMSAALAERFERPLKIAMQFNLSKWVEQMMYMQKSPEDFQDKINAMDIREQYQQIKLMEVSAGSGEQIVLYFALVDKAISNFGQSSWADYRAFYKLTAPDGSLADTAMLTQNHQQTVLPNCRMTLNGEQKAGYVFLQTLPLGDVKNGNVNMVYFLPLDVLAEQAYSYYRSADIALYLTDGSGTHIALGQQGAALGGTEIDRLIGLAADPGQSFYDRAQDAYCMVLPQPQISGNILIVMPKPLVTAELRDVQRLIILLFTAVILLALVFSMYLTSRGYKPIKKLTTNIALDLRPNLPPGNMNDEYAMIELALRALGQQKERLGEVVEAQSDIVQRYTILQAIQTEPREDGGAQGLAAIVPYAHYCLFVLQKPQNHQPYHLAVFAETDSVWYVDMETSLYHLVVASYPRLEVLSILWERIRRDGTMKIGCSEDQTDVAQLRRAYCQAQDALKYHYLLSGRNLIRYEDIRLRLQTRAALRGADTAPLKWHLQTGEKKEAAYALSEILHLLIDTRQCSLPEFVSEMEGLTRQLTDLLQEASAGCPVKLAPLPGAFETAAEYREALSAWLTEQMQRAGKPDQRFVSTAVWIAEYIKDHLSDPNLSQTEVADSLGYTPSYFSRYFKENFNENYHDYVTQRRIALAKELMGESGASIQEIAERVGFANDATFRRAFKNVQGVTPRQYMQKKRSG